MLPPILLVIDDASIGGGQQHVLTLAERLTARGVKVAVVCEASGYLVDELHRRAIPHHALRQPERPSLRALADATGVIRASGARLVHTHGGTAGFYGRLAARRAGDVRAVHTYHGIHYLHQKSVHKRVLHRAIDRFLLRWTDEVICVAKSDRDLALKEGLALPDHVSVIYNGIEPSRFEPRGAKGRAHDRFIVGTVGRLHEQKGHAHLLEAAALVRRALPQVQFRIIGDGPLRGQLEAQARMHRVDDVVEFLGARDDVPEQLRQFDLFVLPSLWEGLPYVLLEAMAAGVPVVATDVDGVREVIADRAEGVLVPPRNAQALADAVIDLAANGAWRAELGAKGAHIVRERFGLDTMIEQTMGAYARALLPRC
ncbi:MAG: glycosyltransferase family 4 protein [Betaproteobacteria bacterium]|nr:glycosyltransferase family 4 protein [Betaproteobacteria bacterium]MDH5350182.1 glycosyltransferase family 4 protein [Betaproteobacteria bacterium]